MADDDVVLSYHDVCLRHEDIDTLKGPYWLNDQVIAFAFEHMTREAFAGVCQGPEPEIVLVPPASSFLALHAGPDHAPLLLEALKLRTAKLAIFPVNDNSDPTLPNGGSHWSALVYKAATRTMRHYDSSAGSGNAHSAKQLAQALKGCFEGPKALDFVQVQAMPKQTNAYDCGCYCCAVVDSVCQWWLSDSSNSDAQGTLESWEGSSGLQGVSGRAQGMRAQLLNSIAQLQQA